MKNWIILLSLSFGACSHPEKRKVDEVTAVRTVDSAAGAAADVLKASPDTTVRTAAPAKASGMR